MLKARLYNQTGTLLEQITVHTEGKSVNVILPFHMYHESITLNVFPKCDVNRYEW